MGRRPGDRKDGTLIRDLDAMHFMMPMIYPNRCDNEAFIHDTVDLTRTNEWLRKKNAEAGEFRYTVFQVVVAAILKTITLRPRMNRFIANKKYYQRNEVSASFIIKKHYNDKSEEGEAVVRAQPEDTIEAVHREIQRQISECRSDVANSTDKVLEIFNRLPRFISRFVIWIMRIFDRHGWVPQSFIESDPYYASVILSNLGSIKLQSGYHHLTNWGTTSMFITVGIRKLRPFYDFEGNMMMKDSLDIGLTIDERIGDGFYFSKTVRMLKKYIENPEYLEMPFHQERLPKQEAAEA